ncbi:hypothetical protein [Sphingopyxis sp. MWB1]|uniref:hypothetical protein n=1 Tax=Sphingopyxis sp. MWB1 TaxID=1537715 RepID=UPI00051A41EB|nr:hypothetical protein [Sphingopyxis sp. MWB1]
MDKGMFAAAIAAAVVSLGAPAGAAAADESGDELLQKGLAGRVTPLDNGVTIKRVGAHPDAGYFLVRLIDNHSTEAAICPRRAFESGQGKRWRQLNDRIYDNIFKREGLWGINAGFAVSNPAGQATRQEIRLISVKNPQAKHCVPDVLGVNNEGAPPRFLFITPINVQEHVYGTEMIVDLKSVHQMEANQQRIDQLWSGLGFFAKTVSAPLAPLVEALAGEGKKEVNDALTQVGGEARAVRRFTANPAGDRTQSEFIYLGFDKFGQTDPATLQGGVTLQGDYQASVLLPATRYLSDLAQPIPQSILSATPMRAADGRPQTVRDRLGAKADALAAQASPQAFSGSCTALRPDLLTLGLSEIDADLWLWAMAKTSSHAAVSGHLDQIACFGPLARANLKRVGGITIEAPVVTAEQVPPSYRAMHRAMDNLGLMATLGAVNADLLPRFAEKIDVSIVDDRLAGAAAAVNGGGRDRAAVLDFMTQNFGRFGCYLPRSDPSDYQLRPFMPLRAGGRAGAMMMHSKDDVPYIVTLGFDPVAKGKEDNVAIVSAIAIQRQGGDTGALVRDLAQGTSDICPKLPPAP